MKRYAAIDIGTNSIRLMLCEVEGTKIINKEKELITTRIGKNVSNTSVISDRALEKNIEALKYFKNRAEKYGAERILTIATSAVRDAENKEDFVNAAKEEVGIEVMVIGGSEEAELGIEGVMSDITDDSETVLVIDIGGGSTELVLGSKKGIEYSISIDAGAVRMTEQYVKQNPISSSDVSSMKQKLSELFKEPMEHLKNKKIDRVIAIGGTATSIAAIYHNLSIYNPKIVHNTYIDKTFAAETFNRLSGMSIQERHQVKGLQKERADVIPVGVLILQHILENLERDGAVISENDNLEGVIIKYVLKTE